MTTILMKRMYAVLLVGVLVASGAHANFIIGTITNDPLIEGDWNPGQNHFFSQHPVGGLSGILSASGLGSDFHSTIDWTSSTGPTQISASGAIDSMLIVSYPPLTWGLLQTSYLFSVYFTLTQATQVHLSGDVTANTSDNPGGAMASVRLLTGGTGTDYLISAPPDAPFSQNLMLAAGNYELQGELSDYQSYDMQGGSHDTASFNLNLEVVPEPISMVMLGCLGVGMAAARKLRRKRA